MGGTLDLSPIGLIVEQAITLNVALSLSTSVTLRKGSTQGIEVLSSHGGLDSGESQFLAQKDFTPQKLRAGFFQSMSFVAHLLDYFGLHSGISLEIKSGVSPGSGLGGSSVMGMTLFWALCEWTGRNFEKVSSIAIVKDIEAQILDLGPTGHQDYYPAIYGGMLALIPHPGHIEVKQLFSEELKEVLEKHLTLLDSGRGRVSGINNWEVYRQFFDKDPKTRQGLAEIARLSSEGIKAIQAKDFDLFFRLMGKEGEKRAELFPKINPPEVKTLYNKLKKSVPKLGIKACGAGGGGHFLLVHPEQGKEALKKEIGRATNMKAIDFSVTPPLEVS